MPLPGILIINVVCFRKKYEETLMYWLGRNKVIILYGARQVGKSTILNLASL